VRGTISASIVDGSRQGFFSGYSHTLASSVEAGSRRTGVVVILRTRKDTNVNRVS
jgi:hypothetical protein